MVKKFPLAKHEDERGWFAELIRASALPKPIKQANLSRSRRGVIRGLHYHERGQDDLFVCLEGMVRVVVLNRETGEVFTEEYDPANPDEHGIPWDDERVRHLWSTPSPILSARDASS